MNRAFKEFVPVPEETGKIMVIEKEFGPRGAEDWTKVSAGIADIVKCAFGTGAIYGEHVLKEKNSIFRKAGISPMLGGTLTEIAVLCRGGYSLEAMARYLDYAFSVGFTHMEISDGSIYILEEDRSKIIKTCVERGFRVISEAGKKDPQKDALITMEKRIDIMKRDLESGAEMVIIEARESGRGIGVMGKDGRVDFSKLDRIIDELGLASTMIETPDKVQQQEVFSMYGPAANVGNIQPSDVLAAGALRAGLRGDTISALRKKAWEIYHDSVNAPSEYKS